MQALGSTFMYEVVSMTFQTVRLEISYEIQGVEQHGFAVSFRQSFMIRSEPCNPFACAYEFLNRQTQCTVHRVGDAT